VDDMKVKQLSSDRNAELPTEASEVDTSK